MIDLENFEFNWFISINGAHSLESNLGNAIVFYNIIQKTYEWQTNSVNITWPPIYSSGYDESMRDAKTIAENELIKIYESTNK